MIVRRTDDRTIEVTAGYLDRLFRSEQHPLQLGEQVHLPRMTATVLDIEDDGCPAKVAFRFQTPLEDASLRWLRFQAGEYVPWTPAATGWLREQPAQSAPLWMRQRIKFWLAGRDVPLRVIV